MSEDMRITKGKETKERILTASMQIISEAGIDGLSAKKIADLSGVSKSNIFHHFGSVDEVLQVLFQSILSNLVEPVKSFEGKNAKQFLHFLGGSIYSLSEEEKLSYTVLLNFYNASLYNEKYRSYLLKTKNELIDAIAGQLSNFSEQSEDRIEKVSEMIVMTLDGYGLHYLLEPDKKTWKEIWSLQVAIWQALLK